MPQLCVVVMGAGSHMSHTVKKFNDEIKDSEVQARGGASGLRYQALTRAVTVFPFCIGGLKKNPFDRGSKIMK